MCDDELQKETDEKEVVYFLPQLKVSSHVFLLQMFTNMCKYKSGLKP